MSTPGRIGYSLPEMDVPEIDIIECLPEGYVRENEPELPEVSELDICVILLNFPLIIMVLIQDFILLDLVR